MEELSRRDMLEVAAVAAAAAGVLAAPGVAGAAGAKAPEAPTSPQSKESNRIDLAAVKPGTVRRGGSLAGGALPVMADHASGVAMLRLDPKALRESHWHPNCWEMQIPLSGKGTLGVVNVDGTWSTQVLGPGDVGFVPKGFAHYIENTGTKPLMWVLAFNAASTETINMSGNFQGMPTHTLATTLGVSRSALAGATKGDKPRVIIP